MSAAEDLQSLTGLFVEAAHLNLAAAEGLAQGQAWEDLAALFRAKEALAIKLSPLVAALEGPWPQTELSKELAEAREAQGAAARSETRLSELLAAMVSQRGNARQAYQQKAPQKSGTGWEVAG